MSLIKRTFLIVQAIVFLMITGCASVNEKHYFKTKNGENYFRVKIDANAGFSQAKYISGFYDESAVDIVFNELKTLPVTSRTTEGSAQTNTLLNNLGGQETLPLNPEKSGVFVMILSTNANSVANTIGNYAQNEQLLESIAILSNQDTLRNAEKLKIDHDALKARGPGFVATIKNILPSPDDAMKNPQLFEQKILSVVQALATELGATESIKSFDDAALAIAQQRN